MAQHSIEPRTRKIIKKMKSKFFSFARKYRKQLLDTELDALKAAFKIEVHKTGESLGNKITDAVTNSHDDKIVKQNLLKK